MRILAGDIGGTKVLLRLVESGAVVREQRFESAAYATFDDLLSEFLGAEYPVVDAACFAVAGPVFDDHAEVTNLTWSMSTAALAERFSIRRVALINDFFAVALGVPLLGPDDLLTLNAGTRVPNAPIAILGAGTGLGQAALVHDGTNYNVVPGEGGHADFAPQDEEQARLFVALLKKYGHVSWERLLSGMGLVNIDDFLRGIERPYDERIPMEIASLADAGEATANRTFEIFVDIYGAEAGNMALRLLARGGVYLAGGIAAKNMRHFTTGRFLDAFLRKGRFTDVMRAIPIDVIVNPYVGLRGAAEAARRLLN
jgi:glucokinase